MRAVFTEILFSRLIDRILREYTVMKNLFAPAIVVALFAASTVVAQNCPNSKTISTSAPAVHAEMDIVDTAVNAGSFKTLVAAVKAAGLVDALKGDGPFTVFAPTDEAFAKLPEGTIAELLKPENKEKLVAILTYHVVPGKVMSGDILGTASAKTLQGQEVTIGLTIDGANVVKADIACSNGVIHVIDSVILPEDK